MSGHMVGYGSGYTLAYCARRFALAALGGAVLLLGQAGTPAPVRAQGAVLEADGAASLGVALRRLGVSKRVLMIAAHPDDENTALMAELALGGGADVAYLSLTRGEGGQNLIGPELQEGLGLIRSEELLAARRLDGARQFFTRAYDFGFSRSAEETLRHWPREQILGDVVEIVRRYRPDIVVSVFSGTPADGHGHHQAAGILAREAFTAAADAARFPEQRARGLMPHRAAYLFQSLWRPPSDPPLWLATGDLDPLFGRSRHQIAMQSRSRHRSQDMGQAEAPGPQRTALRVLAGEFPAGAQSLFAALDTTLSQRAQRAGASAATVVTLEDYERAVEQLRLTFNPLHAHLLVPPLGEALRSLRALAAAAPPGLRSHLHDEIADVADALRQAAGVVVDVVTDAALPAAGETFTVTVTVWNGGRGPAVLRDVAPLLPAEWAAVQHDAGAAGGSLPVTLAPNDVVRHRYRVQVPAGALPTEPYFMREPRVGSTYTWSVADSLRGAPFEPRPVRVAVDVELPEPLRMEREAVFVAIDKALGEVRQPLLVIPAVSVITEPAVAVIAEGDVTPRTYAVTLRSAATLPVSGTLRLRAPNGWTVLPDALDVTLAPGAASAHRFTVTPPPLPAAGTLLRASFTAQGREYDRGYTFIDYPHIDPHALYRDATIRAASFPVRIADGLRIGYIEGAGDDGAEALRQLGAAVVQLDAAALADSDLSVYDAIVAGIRAYEVRTDLMASNHRLLDYAERGGTVIVQYNKYELVDDRVMPFPATMSRPHGRVTDEDAPVTLLAPDHPLLAGPNRITAADFDGWVQERGLYYLESFDARYTPLLRMGDPGQPTLDGGLVAARVGRGWYVYSGLALFRQWPEAVPGAYRLLANMVSLGRTAP
jgi:LmbE family N-acetylglucosaminyl deacetylase